MHVRSKYGVSWLREEQNNNKQTDDLHLRSSWLCAHLMEECIKKAGITVWLQVFINEGKSKDTTSLFVSIRRDLVRFYPLLQVNPYSFILCSWSAAAHI